MDAQRLDTPEGISARLGWDPSATNHDRIRTLARDLVAERMRVEPRAVLITREAPTTFGHHTLLVASVDGVEAPLSIKSTTVRSASVVAVAERGIAFGIDLHDLHPDEATVREIHRHSHLWPEASEADFLTHWTRVQAVLLADARGVRVAPEHVRLDPSRHRGWVPDRPLRYELRDLSRGAFMITLAWAAPAEA